MKEKNMEGLKYLDPFFSCITEQNLYSALVNNDSIVLDFFLQSELFTVEHHSFEFNGVQYASLVDYCFKQHKKENPLVDCFEVLVKHGASLLGTSSIDKLPNAALILLESDHPFKVTFDKYFKFTSKNEKFYEQLNLLLEQWVKQAKCSKEKIEKIELIIKNNKFYKSALEDIDVKLKSMTRSETDHRKKRMMKASEKHVRKFAETIMDVVKEHEKRKTTEPEELHPQTLTQDTLSAFFGLFSGIISEAVETSKTKAKLGHGRHSHGPDPQLRFK